MYPQQIDGGINVIIKPSEEVKFGQIQRGIRCLNNTNWVSYNGNLFDRSFQTFYLPSI
jgi:cell division protein FtsX